MGNEVGGRVYGSTGLKKPSTALGSFPKSTFQNALNTLLSSACAKTRLVVNPDPDCLESIYKLHPPQCAFPSACCWALDYSLSDCVAGHVTSDITDVYCMKRL